MTRPRLVSTDGDRELHIPPRPGRKALADDHRALFDDADDTLWPIVIVAVVAALLPGVLIGIGLGWWWWA